MGVDAAGRGYNRGLVVAVVRGHGYSIDRIRDRDRDKDRSDSRHLNCLFPPEMLKDIR